MSNGISGLLNRSRHISENPMKRDDKMEEETSGFLDEDNSDLEDEKCDASMLQLIYSPFQLVGDLVGCCRSIVRLSVIFTGLYEHIKWSRYSFFAMELIVIYTSSIIQILNAKKNSWRTLLAILFAPFYSTFIAVSHHLRCIFYGFRLRKQKLNAKYLHLEMESLARTSALYWMTEDAMLLATNTLFLTLAHQADWLEFPLPNKYFLTKSVNQVCAEASSITSLNLPEWVLCFVRILIPFFGYWPMDFLFITRVWILLWSCMWACDFLDFSWTVIVYPTVKGKRFRPGFVPQFYQATNRLLELGFRAFGIILSGTVMIPIIFRSLTAQHYDSSTYLDALYTKGLEHYHANETTIINGCSGNSNETTNCVSPMTIQYSMTKDIHDIKKIQNVTITRQNSYQDIYHAVDASIIIYCILLTVTGFFYHVMLEYVRGSNLKINDLNIIIQKSVLFAPYSRYAWKKRPYNTDARYKSTNISLQLVSIPLLFGLLGISLIDVDYDNFLLETPTTLSSGSLWQFVTVSSGYPGGIFYYSSKYFHYYLQTNIFFVTLLPAFIYFTILAISVNLYYKLLTNVRNYEFSLYSAQYSKMYGSYK